MAAPDPATVAFDTLAPDYDAQFTAATNPLIGLVRDRVYAAVDRHVPRGATILEIGCGTGEDTLALLERGYDVVAVDPAPRMLERARAKVAARFGPGRGRFVEATGSALAERWPSLDLRVDAVLSSFAPLNCEPSLAPLAQLLARALPPGGRFLATVLPRVCPWEIALFLARGMPGTALRRFGVRREGDGARGDAAGRTFPVYYYGASDFDRALGTGFRRVESRSMGLFLPPLSFGPAFARVPGLLPSLAILEDRLGAVPGLRRMGDHVLLVYERAG